MIIDELNHGLGCQEACTAMDGDPGRRISVRSVNDLITCVLCGGYLIDATAVMECLHTFCKTCIVRYLETSNYCPVCDTIVHESNPLLNLRRDHTVQNLVYKLVPGLLSREIKRRKEFGELNQDQGDSGICLSEDGSMLVDENCDGRFYREDEHISISLQFSRNAKPPRRHGHRHHHHRLQQQQHPKLQHDKQQLLLPYHPSQAEFTHQQHKSSVRRHYLLCPAPFTVAHLKKFIKIKFKLDQRLKVVVFHTDEPLRDHYTLMDIAYIYTWRRSRPLRLYYSIYEGPDLSIPDFEFHCRRFQQQQTPSSSTATSQLPGSVVTAAAGNDDAGSRPDIKPVIGVDIRAKPPNPSSVSASHLSLNDGNFRLERRRRRRHVEDSENVDENRCSSRRRPQSFSAGDRAAAESGGGRGGKAEWPTKRIKQEILSAEELDADRRRRSVGTASTVVADSSSAPGFSAAPSHLHSSLASHPLPPPTPPSNPLSIPASLRFSPLTDPVLPSTAAAAAARPPSRLRSLSPLLSPPPSTMMTPKLSLPVTISKDFIKEFVVSRVIEKACRASSSSCIDRPTDDRQNERRQRMRDPRTRR